MSASLLSPAFAGAYFAAFRAMPFAGQVAVPIKDGENPDRCRSSKLTPSNAPSFVNTAVDLIENFPRDVSYAAAGRSSGACGWWSSGTAQRPAIVGLSGADGRHVEVIGMSLRGTNDRTVRLYVGYKGLFAEAQMREQVTVDGRNCHRVTVHELRFLGPALGGLKEWLGLASEDPMTGVVLGVLRVLGLDESDAMAEANLSQRPDGRREGSLVRSSSPVRHTVFLWGEDDLRIFFHVPNEEPALNPRATEIWQLAANEAARHRLNQKILVTPGA